MEAQKDPASSRSPELDAILASAGLAVFAVSPDGRLAPPVSRGAKELLGDAAPEGVSFSSFFPGYAIESALGFAFSRPGSWEVVKGLLPAEVEIRGSARILGLEWIPVRSGEGLARILVACTELTERRRLESELDRKETQRLEQQELLSQLLSHPPELAEQFMSDLMRVLEETRGRLEQGDFPALMRSTHTLKGSARIFGLESVQKRAHVLEARVAAALESPPAAEGADELRRALAAEFAALEEALVDCEALYVKTSRAAGAWSPSEEECVSVPLRKFETIFEAMPAQARVVSAEAARKAVGWLLQTSVRGLFDRLERLARSLSEELHRPIRIVREGDGVPMDFRFAGPLYDAFLHAIRNSLDHGAESAEERVGAGKPGELTLAFSASVHPGENLVIEISDDGRGIDVEGVKKRALDKGLLQPEELKGVSREKIIQIVFMPGFSTKDRASYLSGRGIGLDVVKEVVERTLSGEVSMYSEPGKGTRLIARIPLDALARPGGTQYCLFSEETERASMEKLLGVRLADLSSARDRPRRSAVLTDLNAAQDAIRAHGAQLERLVVVDSLESGQLVEWPLARLGARHFVDRGAPALERHLQACIRKLSGASIWGLETCLWPGTHVHSETVTEFARKNDLLDQVLSFASGLKSFSGLPEILALVADEMLMNAMFDAPRDPSGREKYNHLPRTHHLALEPREAVTLSWGADPSFVGVSIEDPFGALSYEKLVSYLHKCSARGKDQIDRKEGGAGLGLFTIFSSAHCLVVNSAPGKRTEVICLIARTRSFERYQKARKSFHFFTEG